MALIHLYNTISNKHEEIKGNGTLRELLPDLDFSHSVVLKAGERVNADVQLGDDDVIFVRVVPGVIEGTVGTVLAITCAVVAVGVGIGAAIYANRMSEEAKEKMEKAQRDADNLASQISQLPYLKGAKNTKSLGRSIQYIVGEMFNTPYLLTDGFTTIDGEDGEKQYWNAILCLGYGKQNVKSVSVGNVKVKDFGDGTTANILTTFDEPTDEVGNPYYDPDSIIEIAQKRGLSSSIFNKKVVATQDGSEIKHDFGQEAEPVVKQCAEHTKKLEVCIQFNGLRQYDTSYSAWQPRLATVKPYWSNDNGATWNEFAFNFPASDYWEETTDEDVISGLIENGDLQCYSFEYPFFWKTQRSDVQILGDLGYYKWQNKAYTDTNTHPRVRFLKGTTTNQLTKNTNHTIRYTATKEFSYYDTHDEEGNELPIIFKIVKDTPKMESNSNEECYLLCYNCYCYDEKKSNADDGLVDAKPMSDWYTGKCTFMGVQMVANESTKDVIDEINVVASGLTRTYDSEEEEWSEDKKVTSNPASWILEILTSDVHGHSQYTDSEIDLNSLAELYKYCEEENLRVDAILTQGEKKNTILQNILSVCFATMYLDAESGKLSFAIDKEESTPVALLNSQCVQSLTVAKSFERKPDGVKTTFTNRDNWQVDTRYCMLDGTDEHDVEDIITELALNYVTTPDHAYKLAQRKMRQERLQPREIKVKIGKEGDYYPLYSTVLLQLEQMKQGICSSVIERVIVVNNEIVALEIGDQVEMVEDFSYGVIIQCEDNNGFALRNCKVINSNGKTRTLELLNPIPLDTDGTLPQAKNILSFGLLDDDGEFTKVTNTMKIYGIGGGDDGIELTLRDYNEDVYSYGVIPPYKSNLTNVPTKLNKVEDIGYKKQIDDVKSEVTEIKSIAYGGSITQLSSLDPTGFTEGALGLYEQKFYRLENGAWRELSSDMYLGAMHEFPENVGIGSYFLCDEDVTKSVLLVTSDGLLEVEDDEGNTACLGVTNVYYSGKLYEFTEIGWKEIDDVTDWRYVIAMNDMSALGMELPYYIRQNIAETTPEYLGAFTQLPDNANIGDWFAYTGATTEELTKGTVYFYNGSEWEEDTNDGHKMQALNDLLDVAQSVTSETTFVDTFVEKLSVNEAFINSLVAKFVTLKDGGFMKSETYDTSGGTKGFYINTRGDATFNCMKLNNTLLKVNTNSDLYTFGATASTVINEEIKDETAALKRIIQMDYLDGSIPLEADLNFLCSGKIFIGSLNGDMVDLSNTYTGNISSLWYSSHWVQGNDNETWEQWFAEFGTLAHYQDNTCKKGGYARMKKYASGRLVSEINFGGTTYSYDTSTGTGDPRFFQIQLYI